MTNLQTRVLSAVVLGAIVLGATLAGNLLFSVMAAVISMLVWSEWIDISSPNADDRIRLSGFILIAVIFVVSLFVSNTHLFWTGVVLLIGVAALTRRSAAGNWPVGGFVYAAGALIALISLRHSTPGAAGLTAILFLFATVWATDIGAYFAGRKIGGPKIAPKISPNKTWSGGVGGVCSAVVAGILVFMFAGLPDIGTAIVLAAILSVVSQAGDFFESWMKRRSGVKDSSQILPGHGGLMDRVDGLVFAAIALWGLGVLISGAGRPASAFF